MTWCERCNKDIDISVYGIKWYIIHPHEDQLEYMRKHQ